MSHEDLEKTFGGLEPRPLWHHFSHFTRIARPSGHEQAMANYVIAWAKERGLTVDSDATGNLCVRVPASPGRENAPAVVLQGHLDMVCEKDADSPYDSEKGTIHAEREGDWIVARGTTLGADNGIGVAAAMAIAEDNSLRHGPLDLLMTIDEETGMTGASGLDPELLRGRIMINLDSEDDGVLFVGCAGGADVKHIFRAVRQEPLEGTMALEVVVGGLKGGHSGLEINRGRMNAIRALARLLQAASQEIEISIASIQGGNKRNAIPRESRALVFIPGDDEALFREAIEKERQALAYQYRGLDDGLTVTITAPAEEPAEVFEVQDSMRLLALIRATPTGVIAMSQDIAGLVETSTNLGVVSTDGDEVTVWNLARSSNAPALQDVLDTLHMIGWLTGVEIQDLGGYPGWKPDMNSRILQVTRTVFEREYTRAPEVTAIHAGLECGLIGDRVPNMDMVSFGPDIRGVHAPGEKVNVPSVGRFYRLLGAVLDAVSA
ncbi:MAG: aminoacyl-histidine dipeptidase [Acidobacteria bacterium]|nr:aminoacyl-histidine dipeptidase [Acidobacteriota bacterium]